MLKQLHLSSQTLKIQSYLTCLEMGNLGVRGSISPQINCMDLDILCY